MYNEITITEYRPGGAFRQVAWTPGVRKTAAVAGGGLLVLAMMLSLWVLPAFGDPSPPALPGAGDLALTFQAGRLSIEAHQVPLVRLLEEIAMHTGIVIKTGRPSGALQETVSLTVVDATVEDILKRLAAHRAFVYTFDPQENTYRLTEAGVFPPGDQTSGSPAIAVGKRAAPHTRPVIVSPMPVDARPPQPPKPRSRPAYIQGELLIQLRADADEKRIRALHAELGSRVVSRVPALRIVRVRLRAGFDEEKALARYRSSGLVEMAGRHTRRYFNTSPNDPYFDNQWGHTASRSTGGWQFTTGNPNIVVAVIDTGVRYQHPDLAANIWVNPNEIPGNGLDDDANGYVDDVRGWDFADNDADPSDGDAGSHGTHVAGIIGAGGNNATGVAGVAWNIRIMPLKVMPDGGNSLPSIDIIAAAVYALENGARVVNCSFGGPAYDALEYLAFTYLRNAGILAACAAGNGTDNDGTPVNTDVTAHYPSGYRLENIVSVAAGNQADGLAYFSNYGAASVDLMAPGVSILSTVNSAGYNYKSGTSMAAPFVAGVAGLMLARKPGWFYPELKAAILGTVTRIPALAGKVVSGGKLNTHFALCSAGTVAGDVTCDNTVGAEDSVAAMQIAAGSGPEICTTCLTAGIDINGDQRIGFAEAAYAVRKDAGL